MWWFFHCSSRLTLASDRAVIVCGVTLRVNQIRSKHERNRRTLSALVHLVLTSGPVGCLCLILSSEKSCFNIFIHRKHPFSLKCSDDIYFCLLQLSRNCEGSHFKENSTQKPLFSFWENHQACRTSPSWLHPHPIHQFEKWSSILRTEQQKAGKWAGDGGSLGKLKF